MKGLWKELLLPIFLSCGAFGVWNIYLSSDVINEKDFTTFSGTLKSAREFGSKKTLFLEFYIKEKPIRFRVGATTYLLFDRESFFENVGIGDKISITAKTLSLENPSPPSLGEAIDTVFAYEIKDKQETYLSLSDVKKRDETSGPVWLVLAILFSLGALFIWFMFFRYAFSDWKETPNP